MLYVTLPSLVWLIDGAIGQTPRCEPQRRRRGDPGPRHGRRQPSAGGSGLAISSRGCSGSAKRFLSRRRSLRLLCPSPSPYCPRVLRSFTRSAAGLASAGFWRPGPSRVLVLALALVGHGIGRAGTCLTRLSLERAGLCADLSAVADAKRRPFRHLRADPGRRRVCWRPPSCCWPRRRPAQRDGAAAAWRWRWARCRLLASAAWGHLRLAGAPAAMVPGVKIRIVQPSVPQREKWRPENQERIFLDHLAAVGQQCRGPPRRPGRHHARDLAGGGDAVPAARSPGSPRGHRTPLAARNPFDRRCDCAPSRPRRGQRQPGAIFNSLLVFGDGGSLPCRLRQDPSRALWRVPAVAGGAGGR